MKSKRAQKELEKLEKFYPFSGWIAPIMARILTASLISSLSRCNSDIDAAISDLARAGADIAAEIDRLNNLKQE